MRAPSASRWTRWRRLAQASVAILYLAIPLLNRFEHYELVGTLAALKIGPVDLVEPAGGLAAALAGRHLALALALGMLPVIALALVAGPVFCSWVCPWGLLSEGIDAIRKRLDRRSWRPAAWIPLRRTRPALLASLFGLGALAGMPLVAILSAPRIITAGAAEVIFLKFLSATTGALLLLLLAIEVLGPRRIWCRALCPVGSFANVLRLPRTLAIRYEKASCLHETPAACHAACPWELDPRQIDRFDGCTNCMLCVDACPGRSLAPSFGGGPGRRR